MHSEAQAMDMLRKCGLKITKQRVAIFAILEENDMPMSADQVFQQLTDRKVSASLSTIYRILDDFTDRNFVTRHRMMNENTTLYEYNRFLHRHYLVCLGCKTILPIEGCPLDDYEKRLEKTTDFTIAGHQLDIYGYCSKCRSNQKS